MVGEKHHPPIMKKPAFKKKLCLHVLKNVSVLWGFQCQLQKTLKYNIWNISKTKNVVKNHGHVFL